MLYRYRNLLAGRPVVIVRADASFDLERSIDTLAALEFPPRPPGWRGLIWDARKRTTCPTSTDIHELVVYFERWDRVAIVASQDAQYGMARMASILCERIGAFRGLRDGLGFAAGINPGAAGRTGS